MCNAPYMSVKFGLFITKSFIDNIDTCLRGYGSRPVAGSAESGRAHVSLLLRFRARHARVHRVPGLPRCAKSRCRTGTGRYGRITVVGVLVVSINYNSGTGKYGRGVTVVSIG